MAPHLVRQLETLGDDVRSEASNESCDWAALAEQVAEMTLSATHLYLRIEAAASRRQPPDPKDWSEAISREFIPICKVWFDYATRLKELRKSCKAHGHQIEGGAEFLHAYNRAKIMTLHFDSTLASLRRIERGE